MTTVKDIYKPKLNQKEIIDMQFNLLTQQVRQLSQRLEHLENFIKVFTTLNMIPGRETAWTELQDKLKPTLS